MQDTVTLPPNVVNTNINWLKPLELQSGVKLTVLYIDDDIVNLRGQGFTVTVTRTTGLPICDVFNWDHFPVKNTE